MLEDVVTVIHGYISLPFLCLQLGIEVTLISKKILAVFALFLLLRKPFPWHQCIQQVLHSCEISFNRGSIVKWHWGAKKPRDKQVGKDQQK